MTPSGNFPGLRYNLIRQMADASLATVAPCMRPS